MVMKAKMCILGHVRVSAHGLYPFWHLYCQRRIGCTELAVSLDAYSANSCILSLILEFTSFKYVTDSSVLFYGEKCFTYVIRT
jgi:hypothetical protein